MCVEFNVPAFGTVYGAPVATPPGAVVFVENAVPVSVHWFLDGGGGWQYNLARIEFPPVAFGVGQVARSNNINLGFSFGGVGFPVKTVTLEWLDLGGVENLSVNGSAIFVGELDTPPAVLGGAAVTSAWVAVPGGQRGRLRISGAQIGRLMVGGQELWIDRVCAHP